MAAWAGVPIDSLNSFRAMWRVSAKHLKIFRRSISKFAVMAKKFGTRSSTNGHVEAHRRLVDSGCCCASDLPGPVATRKFWRRRRVALCAVGLAGSESRFPESRRFVLVVRCPYRPGDHLALGLPKHSDSSRLSHEAFCRTRVWTATRLPLP